MARVDTRGGVASVDRSMVSGLQWVFGRCSGLRRMPRRPHGLGAGDFTVAWSLACAFGPCSTGRGKQSNCQEANVDIPHPVVRIHLRVASTRRLPVSCLSPHALSPRSPRERLSQLSTTFGPSSASARVVAQVRNAAWRRQSTTARVCDQQAPRLLHLAQLSRFRSPPI
jgi:hypothetical protein